MKAKLAKSRIKSNLKERLEPVILLILTIILGLMLKSYGRKIDMVRAYEDIEINYSEPVIIEKEIIREVKVAKVTAYSCGGLTTEAEINMNCPSLKSHKNGRTATGTTPEPYKTVACDKANLGKTFEIKGIGLVKCEDLGGDIKGSGRFDLYVENVNEAYNFGTQYLEYWEI